MRRPRARSAFVSHRWTARGLLGLACALAVLCSSCGTGEESDSDVLTIFAAASTTEVVEALSRSFEQERPECRLRLVFGPSSGLARQILDGAPADVFVSASQSWIDALASGDRLAPPAVRLAANRLCIITRSEGAIVAAGPAASPRDAFARLATDDRIAIADAGVPAGEYARAALASTGDAAFVENRLVGLVDVRDVLRSVKEGEAALGFVYATDARIEPGVAVLFTYGPGAHPPIELVAAVVRDSALARDYLAHLTSPLAQHALADKGFSTAGSRGDG